jgi:glycosyltransferase involved in cell wall biosynthesis
MSEDAITMNRASMEFTDKRQEITVLMPVNAYYEDFLLRAVESIIRQTSPLWRLLVIVEGKTGSDVLQLLSGGREDPRIQFVRNEGRKLAGAINTGMRYAETDFVAVLLGDDMWAPEAVSVVLNHVAQYPEVDFFHSSRIVIDENDTAISDVLHSRQRFESRDFVNGSPVKHLLCWRKKKALTSGGLDESLNSVGPDDYDFPWTMADNGARFMAIRECLYYYRNHCSTYRLTTHIPLSVHKREVRRILKKHGIGWVERRRIVRKHSSGSLGAQCIFRSSLDKWIKGILGYDARKDWKRPVYRRNRSHGECTPLPVK